MVMRYSSGSRIDSNFAEQILKSHDIILTTYTEILNSYPKNEPPIDCQTAEQKIDWWKKQYAKHRGVLHRLMFHRVVLDEAQAIKNHTSRTSIACRALMAKHKWALSGTPIVSNFRVQSALRDISDFVPAQRSFRALPLLQVFGRPAYWQLQDLQAQLLRYR
jgi:SNF2 family DNA or RNA helicase